MGRLGDVVCPAIRDAVAPLVGGRAYWPPPLALSRLPCAVITPTGGTLDLGRYDGDIFVRRPRIVVAFYTVEGYREAAYAEAVALVEAAETLFVGDTTLTQVVTDIAATENSFGLIRYAGADYTGGALTLLVEDKE